MRPLDYKGMSGIYRLTNSRGEYYIGSSKDVYNRLRSHKCLNTMNDSVHNIKVEILEVTTTNLKEREHHYILTNWSEKIINKEKLTKGRDINGVKNPMYKVIPIVHCLDCKTQISYHTTKQAKRCKSCASKNRQRDENTKSFI